MLNKQSRKTVSDFKLPILCSTSVDCTKCTPGPMWEVTILEEIMGMRSDVSYIKKIGLDRICHFLRQVSLVFYNIHRLLNIQNSSIRGTLFEIVLNKP